MTREDFFKSVSILFTLRRMIALGIELHEAALSSNNMENFENSVDKYDDRIESIMSFRKSARLVKQKFLLKNEDRTKKARILHDNCRDSAI